MNLMSGPWLFVSYPASSLWKVRYLYSILVYLGELTFFFSLVGWLEGWKGDQLFARLYSNFNSMSNVTSSKVTVVFWLCSTFCSCFSFQREKLSIHLPKNNSANIWEELRYQRKSSPDTDRPYKNYWTSRNVLYIKFNISLPFWSRPQK